tara:strand:- start:262 stop:672 length:411 start_codon:yes stop_codon:yes gene_type:complete
MITRGIKHDVDRFITELQGKYLPFQAAFKKDGHVDEKGKLKPQMLQLSVRPIQLWEVVFPEPCRDAVLNTLFKNGKGKTQHSKHQKYLWTLRKALGCEPIPYYEKNKIIPVYDKNIERVGIGIKKDKYYENGMEAI